MQCPACKKTNDPDALFCCECGKPFAPEQQASAVKSRTSYLFMLALLPMLIVMAAIGYYKYFLPDGVAAVVNGEEITLSELDAVARAQGNDGPASGTVRYQILNRLITERIVLQEARKAGLFVTKREIASAVDEVRAASGLDGPAFTRQTTAQYGGARAFEDAVARRLLTDKFLFEKVVPRNAGPQASRAAMDQWFAGLSGRAAVRIALAEQGTGPGCGCCNKGRGQARQGQAAPGKGNSRITQ